MPNNFISWMIVILMFVFLMTFAVDAISPIYINSSFKSICEEYNQILIKEGKLTSSEKAELTSRLSEKGFNVISLNVPNSMVWGDEFTFEVVVQYTQSTISANFFKTSKIHTFKYKKTGVALRGGV